jgi:hypothetical protein
VRRTRRIELIIAHMGFSMLGGENGVGRPPPPQDGTDLSGRSSPLIMFAAGPGTIASIGLQFVLAGLKSYLG